MASLTCLFTRFVIGFSRWLLGALLLLSSLAFGQSDVGLPALFVYQPGDAVTDAQAGIPVSIDTSVVTRSLPGFEVEFRTPNGKSYVYVTDAVSSSKTGNSHWVAHLRGAGTAYRAIISYGNAVGFGSLATPDGNFRLNMQDGQLRLLDLEASNRRPQIFNSEPLIAPVPSPQPSKKSATSQAPVAATLGGVQTIDLLVLYTNGLANKLGLEAMQTRMEYLVALTNQAYADSQVNIRLRLVHTAQVSYSDQVNHNVALQDLTYGGGAFNGVSALRSAYGADVVTLLNQFDTTTDTACGLAWMLGSNGTSMNADNAFSVVSVGDDVAGSNGYCSDYALAHELGHNMGSVHDRAHSSSPGAYAYSYGYGIGGRFGDIMSYIWPQVGKFSNPAISCGSLNDPCGISESDGANGANNALSLNNTAPTVAAFRVATSLDTTPDDFSFSMLTGVNGAASLVSEAITLSGLSTSVGVSISGGEYSISGGAFSSANGTVTNGQSVRVRLSASTTPYATASAMLTVGTLSRAFHVVTKPTAFTSTSALAAGFAHSVALRSDGTVWAWGDNSEGALGDGTTSNHSLPVLVAGISAVKAIAAAGGFSLALNADGSVWGWGNSDYGQLGIMASINKQAIQIAGLSNVRKIAAGYFDALAIDNGDAVWSWGNFSPTPVRVSGIAGATAIAAGMNHRLALLRDGSLRAWGTNSNGQLGLGSTSNASHPTLIRSLSNVIAIAAGTQHSLALRADGTVWSWGDNSDGQLGDGTTTQRTVPVAVAGVGGIGQLSSVVAIAAGPYHSLAIKSDGRVIVWGQNIYGQLGDGSTQNHRSLPVALALTTVSAISAFTAHSLALKNDGSVWAWGLSNQGEVGDGTTTWRTAPVRVGGTNWLIGGGDMEPDPLSLGSSSALAGSTVTSAPITVNGINQATPISIIGGEYSIDGGAYTGAASIVNSGQAVSVRVTAPAVDSTSASAVLTIGGVSSSFTVTAVASTVPDTAEIAFLAGWNLVGNGTDAPIDVTITFGDQAKVITVWKWLPASNQWAFHTPGLRGQALTDYLSSKGYAAFTTVNAGEGFWVNAKQPFTATVNSGYAITAAKFGSTLVKGWNLMSLGEAPQTPSAFNTALGYELTSLWAWDNPMGQWYFYAPSLERSGDLSGYITSKTYLDFSQQGKTLGWGTGFWVNKP